MNCTFASAGLPAPAKYRRTTDWNNAIQAALRSAQTITDAQIAVLRDEAWPPETAEAIRHQLRRLGVNPPGVTARWPHCPAGTGGGHDTL